MSNAVISAAKNTHYAVSTFAAIVYAAIWFAANAAHAANTGAAMPEVFVTATRDYSQAEMPELIVWGTRESAATEPMEEVFVYATREPSDAVAATGKVVVKAKGAGSWIAQARRWLQATLHI